MDIEKQIIDYAEKRKIHAAAVRAEIEARHQVYSAGNALAPEIIKEAQDQIGQIIQYNGRDVMIRDIRPHHVDKSVVCPLVVERLQSGRDWGKRANTLASRGWDRSRKVWDTVRLDEQTGRAIFEGTGKAQE